MLNLDKIENIVFLAVASALALILLISIIVRFASKKKVRKGIHRFFIALDSIFMALCIVCSAIAAVVLYPSAVAKIVNDGGALAITVASFSLPSLSGLGFLVDVIVGFKLVGLVAPIVLFWLSLLQLVALKTETFKQKKVAHVQDHFADDEIAPVNAADSLKESPLTEGFAEDENTPLVQEKVEDKVEQTEQDEKVEDKVEQTLQNEKVEESIEQTLQDEKVVDSAEQTEQDEDSTLLQDSLQETEDDFVFDETAFRKKIISAEYGDLSTQTKETEDETKELLTQVDQLVSNDDSTLIKANEVEDLLKKAIEEGFKLADETENAVAAKPSDIEDTQPETEQVEKHIIKTVAPSKKTTASAAIKSTAAKKTTASTATKSTAAKKTTASTATKSTAAKRTTTSAATKSTAAKKTTTSAATKPTAAKRTTTSAATKLTAAKRTTTSAATKPTAAKKTTTSAATTAATKAPRSVKRTNASAVFENFISAKNEDEQQQIKQKISSVKNDKK